jgi:hypothetical protein
MNREAMKRIKTWHDRCEEHPDHQERIISERMIQARMQEEIDELRQALETEREWVGLTEREVELIDEMIETQLLHAERCDHIANSTMAQKQKAWDLERVELLRKLKERNT